MVCVPDLSLQTWLAGEVWGWLLTMHTSSPGATITGPGPAIQETLALHNGNTTRHQLQALRSEPYTHSRWLQEPSLGRSIAVCK